MGIATVVAPETEIDTPTITGEIVITGGRRTAAMVGAGTEIGIDEVTSVPEILLGPATYLDMADTVMMSTGTVTRTVGRTDPKMTQRKKKGSECQFKLFFTLESVNYEDSLAIQDTVRPLLNPD